MSNFKDMIRACSNDSEEYAQHASSTENQAIDKIANRMVSFIKNEIKNKASAGDFVLKDGKHYISDYCEFYCPLHGDDWIEFRNVKKDDLNYTPSSYSSQSADLATENYRHTLAFFKHKITFKQVDIEVLERKRSEFFNYLTFTMALSVSEQETKLRNRVKQLLSEDGIGIAAYFLITESAGWNSASRKTVIVSQEIIDAHKIKVKKSKKHSLTVTLIYKYEFEY
ncbi:MAG: hypothetical protein E7600_03555 [Ruminococcaceae bacterium]|nr:hypothetical protein [Oscillospiraceae bacterium]